MSEISAILAALAAGSPRPAALATLVRVQGSSYRRPGARLLSWGDGERIGGISGGCLEEDIVVRAQDVIHSGQSQVTDYDTTKENDLAWGLGLGCQGVVRVLIEPIPPVRPRWLAVVAKNLEARRPTPLSVVHANRDHGRSGTFLADETPDATPPDEVFLDLIAPPPPLVVFGAGDDARPLVRMASEVGWQVTVVDSRGGYATRRRFPDAQAVVNARADELSRAVPLDADAYVVVMTHRFAEDVALLRFLSRRSFAYLGILGPRHRTARLLEELRAEDAAAVDELSRRLCAPIGLDLGATTPETIALSILAEMQCWRTGRTPIHLRDRTVPIHSDAARGGVRASEP